ncbi:kinetochore protein Nuf2-like [Mercenaria mercenaria]|uniref:kinetochore protein Nuf2-like n=1 Tax=Mercenaria mercenaria TaxID=6596 RepID=UPI00234EF938|nr:kinetochore protein Nuf2-like [Mercenaria mercenaria]
MEDDEFNFHRIVKSEKTVAQLALQDLLESLWNQKYPETPWTKNEASVKLFEEKEDKHFQNSLQGLSHKEKERKIQKRNRLQNTFRDDNWKNYEWDISKFAYALVDSKLFDLDVTDATGMPVSEHIVMLKNIRNTTAHFTTFYCDTDYSKKTLMSIEDHIKALELVKLNVSPYIEKLQRIKTEEKPVSIQVWFEMRTQFEKLKSSQEVYEERERRYLMQEKLCAAESEKHSKELERLKTVSEYALLKQSHTAECERIKQSYSMEVERLQSENALLKQNHLREVERLQSEHALLKQSYLMEVERLQSENALLKQSHLREVESLQSENELQKQRLESVINLHKRKHSENLKEFQKLKSEKLESHNKVQKTTEQTNFDRCKRNGILKAVIVIMMIWHQVKSK